MGRDLRRAVLVDNNAFAQLGAPDNAVVVGDFTGEEREMGDDTLLQVTELITRLDAATAARGEGGEEVGDVRPLLRKAFKFREKLAGHVDFDAIERQWEEAQRGQAKPSWKHVSSRSDVRGELYDTATLMRCRTSSSRAE